MSTLHSGRVLAHYRIVRALGRGGQATAWLAEDRRLGRPVVLKALPTAASDAPARRRLEREACLLSILDNPNICAVYDLGEADGITYVAMQYVEGPTLRELLDRGRLSLLSALSIAIQVADALSLAHAAGVVHRDVKPGNVIVTASGQAKVLDFGLARALSPERGGEADDVAQSGVPYGTLGYGSPEQATGDPADHRSDVFSVGVLLYEMATGRRPFRGKYPVDVLRSVVNDAPAPVSVSCRDCPRELQEIVDRALAKRPADRYQTMAAFRDDLKALMRRLSRETGVVPTEASATLLRPEAAPPARWFSGSALGRALTRLRAPGNGGRRPDPSLDVEPERERASFGVHRALAVLPFRNLSGDPALDPLALALADGVITASAALDVLEVRPLASVVQYAEREVAPVDAAAQLAVGWLVTGSYVASEDRVRVSAQLLAAHGDSVLWADRVDAPRADMLQAQDALADRVLAALRLHLAPQPAERADPPNTRNAQAYAYYLRGREILGHFVQRTFDVDDLELAIRLLNEAAGADPGFVAVHAALGRAYLLHAQGYGGPEYVRLGERSLRRALDLEPTSARARVQLAYVQVLDGDKDGARALVASVERDLAGHPGLLELQAHLHRLDGRHGEAMAVLDYLRERSPSDAAVVAYKRARVLVAMGRPAEARAAAEEAERLAPHHAMVHVLLALADLRGGEPRRAVERLEAVLRRHRDLDGARPLLACALAEAEAWDGAHALLTDRVREAARADTDTAFWLACAHARLGDAVGAAEWLGQARRLGLEDGALVAGTPELARVAAEAGFPAGPPR